MIGQIFCIGVGAAFGMSKYGTMLKSKIKAVTKSKTDIVKFENGTYGIRCKWIGFTMYSNLSYSGSDPFNRWYFQCDKEFADCQGTLEECKNKLVDSSKTETVVETVND